MKFNKIYLFTALSLAIAGIPSLHCMDQYDYSSDSEGISTPINEKKIFDKLVFEALFDDMTAPNQSLIPSQKSPEKKRSLEESRTDGQEPKNQKQTLNQNLKNSSSKNFSDLCKEFQNVLPKPKTLLAPEPDTLSKPKTLLVPEPVTIEIKNDPKYICSKCKKTYAYKKWYLNHIEQNDCMGSNRKTHKVKVFQQIDFNTDQKPNPYLDPFFKSVQDNFHKKPTNQEASFRDITEQAQTLIPNTQEKNPQPVEIKYQPIQSLPKLDPSFNAAITRFSKKNPK